MKVYESTGSFDPTQESFSLLVQTTNISPDAFEVTKYYNVSNASRYAIVAILQTKNGNATNFSNYTPNTQLSLEDVSFNELDPSYLQAGDKDLADITTSDTITVYVHHGIGFNPSTNTYDNKYLENYKAGTYIYYAAGSPPGAGGGGNLPG